MLHALVFYPDLRHEGVAALRARHDPTARVVREHLTLIFPLPDEVGREALGRHVRAVVFGWRPFRLHLTGLEKSWDHWLFLAVREGGDEVTRLHDDLYGGILAPHLRRDLPYTPHVGLGLFAASAYDPLAPRAAALDEERYRRALGEAEALGLDFWRVVDRVTLLALDEDLGSVRDVEVIPLGGAAAARA